jgi:hypothetical protein
VTVPSYLLSARGGDRIFFWGADASDAVHLVTDVVSNGNDGSNTSEDRALDQVERGLGASADRLRERTRVMLDWNAVWEYLLGRIGLDHYSIKTIFDYLARAVPLLGRLPLFCRPAAIRNFNTV